MSSTTRIKNSIAFQLLRAIFGLYLLVTIFVTTSQMYAEYRHVGEQITRDIAKLPTTFGPGIETSLWTYNNNLLQSILIGMLENEVVVGVKIDDGMEIKGIGIIEQGKGQYVEISNNGERRKYAANEPFLTLISHEFNITHTDNQGQSIALGKGIIYSSSAIIYARIKHGFMLIIVNSVIKTLALWFIFIFFIQRILGRPLAKLTLATEQTHLNNLIQIPIDASDKNNNELRLLQEAFNNMMRKLASARGELNAVNKNLENIVALRTQDLKQEIKAREQAQYEAEQANQVKSMFIANMSHEIRTPMTGIFGMARILQASELNEDQKKYIDVVIRNSKALLTLINDLLDYSKLEAKALELEIERFDLRICVADIINLFTLQASEKGLTLSYSVDPAIAPTVLGDSARLGQILINLISNALKFSSHGNVTLTAQPYTESAYEALLFCVTDSGIGIREDKLTQIFGEFTQADASTTRKYGGTGLGLTICKHLCELMGGRIWVQSEVGKGSAFYFTLRTDYWPDTLPAPNREPTSVKNPST